MLTSGLQSCVRAESSASTRVSTVVREQGEHLLPVTLILFPVLDQVKVNISDCDSVASIYSFIMPYRLLMLRHVSKDVFTRVATLPDHIVQRAGTGEWDIHQREVVNFLRRRCFLSKKFTDEDIHRAIGGQIILKIAFR